MNLQTVSQKDLIYDLPEDRIAKHPAAPRDASKLLIYRNKEIRHRIFREVTDMITSDFTMFFNNTKVIPARLFFQKDTGAIIELFLLNPLEPSSEITRVMSENQACVWVCKVGKLKRIKDDTSLQRTEIIDNQKVTLFACIINREKQHVHFSWDNPKITFAELLAFFGVTPLPPYLKRTAQVADKVRYQTVYSEHEGAVAAPTAGLHFTENTIKELENKGVSLDYLTLHVSGGTFQPVQHENVVEHPMHSEQILISRKNIESILNAQKILSVGTTSMRTLESLYWFGVKLAQHPENEFFIEKLFPYQQHDILPHLTESMRHVLDYMRRKNLDKLSGSTEIMIMPSYTFRVCDALMTNFHLPGSTLIMLVSAFVGDDWRKIYQNALDNNYRFLSFGDSSLLFR